MKIELGAQNCLYPMPTTLVGATVEGRPNFLTIAHVGIMDLGSVSLGMARKLIIRTPESKRAARSVNLPSTEMVQVTDFCGLVSGRRADKAELFSVFYGNLKTAPMINECPVNMECKLKKVVDFPKHDVFIGEIVATYAEEEVLTDGVVDYSKVQPFFFTMPDKGYWNLGERFAQAWSVGKVVEKRQKT